jgi:hypothetical protein
LETNPNDLSQDSFFFANKGMDMTICSDFQRIKLVLAGGKAMHKKKEAAQKLTTTTLQKP